MSTNTTPTNQGIADATAYTATCTCGWQYPYFARTPDRPAQAASAHEQYCPGSATLEDR